MKRRAFIEKASAATLAGAALMGSNPALVFGGDEKIFTLPSLPYAYDALEPHMDALTMQIHHSKHHQAYVDKLNDAIKSNPEEKNSLDNILAKVSKLPVAFRNHGGGHYNHSFFWQTMKPGGKQNPSGKLMEAMDSAFHSFDAFREQFAKTASGHFGSGWAWLVVTKDKKLKIGTTPNQDNPLMDVSELKGIPVLGMDLWEHAYYLKYQNKRADYINAWWNVVNWQEVEKRFDAAIKE
jgi:Fe-Mn family superoxide dismutase